VHNCGFHYFIDLAVPCQHTYPATGFAMMTTLKL
jgi:hypothetical protein